MRWNDLALALLASGLLACGGSGASTGSGGSGGAATGAGGEAGGMFDACPSPEVLVDGECVPTGVPPDACGEGFEHDGDAGCLAIMPEELCPDGTLAIPGQTACQPVGTCSPPDWSDLAVEANAQFVDQSYVGGDADGSADKPWPTIGQAVAAAADGAQVLVAAGSYAEDVALDGKSLRIWGRCPELVEVVGQTIYAAIALTGADASELHNLAVTGAGRGLDVISSQNVLVEDLWIHDTGSAGVIGVDALGPASVTLRDSLVEAATIVGVVSQGCDMSLERSAIRETQPNPDDQRHGRGLEASRSSYTTSSSTVTMDRSVVEQVHNVGILVAGCELLLDSVLVRDTLPQVSDSTDGRGMGIQPHGFVGEAFAGRGSVELRGTVIERHSGLGLYVSGSDGLVESTTIRDITPRPSDGAFGRGLEVGGAIHEGPPPDAGAVTIRHSLIDRVVDVGLMSIDSEVEADRLLVRNVTAGPTSHVNGDGVVTVADEIHGGGGVVASLRLHGTRVEGAPRAGIGTFGGNVTLGESVLECNTIQLNGEQVTYGDYAFDNLGGNHCGCDGTWTPCKVLSSSLSAPDPVDP